ncbi:MAG TPA: cytochrome aa3 quinol oxidase subunit IV [Bacillales bacterium]|nr:cytochrome aa3 quinol oxidase subunit IV [Bacillales bacterium]
MGQNKKEVTGGEHQGFPTQQVIGFILSIVLTIIAMWVALGSGLSKGWILGIIVVFAFFQASVQLFMFMHVNEGKDGKMQTANMIHAFVAFIIVIAGSIWVMSFGMHYMH